MYAHSPNRAGQWHSLEDHLRGTARRAFEFGDVFGGGAAAEALGRWHDLGKVHPDFQAYLAGNRPRGGDHKLAGTLLAQEFGAAALLGLAIEGHHGGLPQLGEFSARIKLEENVERARGALTSARAVFPGIDAPPTGEVFPAGILAGGRHAWEHFVRMVFSALVDADFLDTEQHFDPQRAATRPRVETSMDEMLATLLRDQDRQFGGATGGLAEARRAIFEDCLEAADRPPGVFRLTVPTGGGKTRAGLAFALKHAARHGMRRVIIAVPFISITEQTAAVYQEIFADVGQTLVLEHHSGVREADEDGPAGRGPWARLAAENWDMPLIVTTTVQLLESLFADRPSDTRKIHNIAGSVIVLDEAQSIPSHLLGPTLDMLRGLVEHYGVTVVLSTATQPAFEVIPAFRDVEATSIIRDPGRWYRTLQRVEYDIRLEPQSWDMIAGWLSEERQALAIVNTKADAIALLDALDDADALHLSTSLCGAHRRATIEEIHRRLRDGEPCLVVSTQVVEAGVDLDFPAVYRAVAPLDAIVQAAGRCNREGGLPGLGRVVVFNPAEGGAPGGPYRAARDIALQFLRGTGRPDSLEVLEAYYRRLLTALNIDPRQIQVLRAALDYPEVARLYRVIEEDTEPAVITEYGSEEARAAVRRLIERLRLQDGSPRYVLRLLQPYVVSIRTRATADFRARRLIEEIVPGVWEWTGGYDAIRGIQAAPSTVLMV